MFVRKKKNKSGTISVQVVDKSSGRYHIVKSFGSSSDPAQVEALLGQAKRFVYEQCGDLELDFTHHKQYYHQILGQIEQHTLVGIQLVLGKLFDQIGFNRIDDPLFKDLVLYRLVYPVSKLKTSEYLARYEHKSYTKDDIYRYMDKLESTHKDLVQHISYQHSLKVLGGSIQAVFYDVTTLYFEIDREDEFRKTGFSKDGKHQNPQIVLGLLVSEHAYPLAYDIFEGNTFEGDTFLPILQAFRAKYEFKELTVVADAGLMRKSTLDELQAKGYHFIIGARIKNETETIKQQILQSNRDDGQACVIDKDPYRLIVSYSTKRAEKDAYNRRRGLAKLEKRIASGRLTKANLNSRGYNKFLKMEGKVQVQLDREKVETDAKWDGLKGYVTNTDLSSKQILSTYNHLWKIEKAFKVAKSELRIRPVYHHKLRRIQAHICLNFVAYKVYKELDRHLKIKGSTLSPEKVIEIIQTIYQVRLTTPYQEVIEHTLILTDEQRQIQQLFNL
jgi:transposase